MTSIEDLISNPPLLLHSSLSQLRYLILSEGLPISEDKQQQRTRCYVWTVLSQTSMEASTQRYLALLKLGPPSTTIYQKKLRTTHPELFRRIQTLEIESQRMPSSGVCRALLGKHNKEDKRLVLVAFL